MSVEIARLESPDLVGAIREPLEEWLLASLPRHPAERGRDIEEAAEAIAAAVREYARGEA